MTEMNSRCWMSDLFALSGLCLCQDQNILYVRSQMLRFINDKSIKNICGKVACNKPIRAIRYIGLTTKTYKHINHFTILSKVLVYTHLHLMKETNENLENY